MENHPSAFAIIAETIIAETVKVSSHYRGNHYRGNRKSVKFILDTRLAQ